MINNEYFEKLELKLAKKDGFDDVDKWRISNL